VSNTLFVDTSAFLALSDSDNPHHDGAGEYVKSLFGETTRIVSSSLVVEDAATQIRDRLGAGKAKKFLDYFEKEGIVLLKHNDSVHLRAKDMFLEHADDQELVFYDFIKVALMHYYHTRKIFTFEEKFDKLNVIRVPKGRGF